MSFWDTRITAPPAPAGLPPAQSRPWWAPQAVVPSQPGWQPSPGYPQGSPMPPAPLDPNGQSHIGDLLHNPAYMPNAAKARSQRSGKCPGCGAMGLPFDGFVGTPEGAAGISADAVAAHCFYCGYNSKFQQRGYTPPTRRLAAVT